MNCCQKTFAMIKPEALENAGMIIHYIQCNEFYIEEIKKAQLTSEQARVFYAVHKAQPWFEELISYIVSGPVILLVLSRADAVNTWRKLMGATDPLKADPGTIRKMFGSSIESNAVHGSDSEETAAFEINLFFGATRCLQNRCTQSCTPRKINI